MSARSVAFPAISTGLYGYPADLAAGVALATVRSADTRVDEVTFVVFGGRARSAYETAAEQLGVSWSS